MAKAAALREKLMPWGGLLLGALGAGLAHQTGSDSLFANCARSGTWTPVIAAFLGLVLIGLGAFASWTVWKRDGEGAPRRLIAKVSLILAALLAFATVMPIVAALLIPACHA